MNQRICFIGAGNMAASLIGGLLAQDYPANLLSASDPDAQQRATLQASLSHPISLLGDNISAVSKADIVVLAVKPQIMGLVGKQLKASLSDSKALFISIAAGITLDNLADFLGDHLAIVRSMPNTPALVQKGAIGLYANTAVSNQQRQATELIVNAVGKSWWLPKESDLDAVTALSGSGPAYYFLVMEAMIEAGINMGLDPLTAKQMTLSTAEGAAAMALLDDTDVDELRRRVTSPGGTTEAALQSFANNDLKGIFASALKAAQQRSIELAKNN